MLETKLTEEDSKNQSNRCSNTNASDPIAETGEYAARRVNQRDSDAKSQSTATKRDNRMGGQARKHP